MNQSILFPDIQTWNEEKQEIVFPVQVQGVNLECVLPITVLEEQAQKSLSNEVEILAAFDSLRFDIEDSIEELIENQQYDESKGVIELHL